jgi:hypothetical protein
VSSLSMTVDTRLIIIKAVVVCKDDDSQGLDRSGASRLAPAADWYQSPFSQPPSTSNPTGSTSVSAATVR